jgi:hypothetical protein
VLVNPNNPNAIPDSAEMQEAGRSIGVTVQVVQAGNDRELDDAFAKAVQLRADALIVHIDALFQARDKQVVALAAKYDVFDPPIHSAWRPDQLRNGTCRCLSSSRHLCWPRT